MDQQFLQNLCDYAAHLNVSSEHNLLTWNTEVALGEIRDNLVVRDRSTSLFD
jgi:hypothetical protein